MSLSAGDWLVCAAVANSVLWLRELIKIVIRAHEKSAVRQVPLAPTGAH
ncbi:hypothetical protein [Microvirga massiliensis]|nr:hypothetical protein [Microvirga massiliensis]